MYILVSFSAYWHFLNTFILGLIMKIHFTYSEMGVDAGVAGGAREILVLPVGNVLVGAGIPELFGQTKIYHITQVALV